MDVFWTLPPVSRTITAAAVAVSALGFSGVISLYDYVFIPSHVFTLRALPQVWRLATAFLITKPKFGIVLDPYFLYMYGSGLEKDSSRFSQPGDFFVYTLFVGSAIVALAGGLLGGYTFLPALSLAYAYTYAQDNPTRQVQFFIINFDAKFLPWAMLFMTFIIDGPDQAKSQLAGLVAAHLFDFLTRIWPTFGGGRNYIYTPAIIKRWFGAAPNTMQNRGYGFAMPGRTDPPPAAARSSGSVFGNVGPGRRLGGD